MLAEEADIYISPIKKPCETDCNVMSSGIKHKPLAPLKSVSAS